MSLDDLVGVEKPLSFEYSCGEVPVEHLDYSYIETCKDIKHLEKILEILRSGEKGIYPHLVEFCENHLNKLNPKSRALRKDLPEIRAASLPVEERNEINEELNRWEEDTKNTESLLKQQSMVTVIEKDKMPPVRGSNSFCPLSKNSTAKGPKNLSKCPLPRDYKEWDKFDVEKECKKIDDNSNSNGTPSTISNQPEIKTEIDTSSLSHQERLVLANREKNKGNEAFKAHDYKEAVAYYTRSLSMFPSVAVYNNRAQAEINRKNWDKALADCQQVLEMEPGNKKGLLRRAVVYNNMENFPMATEDLKTVLKDEPHNQTAINLLSKIEKKMSVCKPEQKQRGKKILIQEVEEESEEEEEDHQTACQVESSQLVGGEESSAAPAERGDMGNSQKKPHSRGDGGPHSESNNQGSRRNRGGSSDKYKVSQEKVANGSSKRDSTASASDQSSGSKAAPAGEPVNLDAPCGALPPALSRLKNEGNLLFKNGQFADALEKYSLAIQGYTESGLDSPEDLCVLYSNRAACYLKDGNSQDCIQDCTRALELQPFSLKPLLRRAMAYESLERYRKAYVDYKTVLQIDTRVQAAQDSVNRITKILIDQDGSEWREKLPDIPLVPLSAQQHHKEEPLSAEELQARAEKAARDAERRTEVLFSALKQEGNEYVKKGQYQNALGKYSECLKLKPKECAIYTNRALCFLKLEMFSEAKQDCDAALKMEPTNKKAFYRRAMANKGLKDYAACSSDLQEVLQQDPNVQEAEKELEEVKEMLKQSVEAKARKSVPITEVDDDDDPPDVSATSCKENNLTINLHPTTAYDFGQSLNAARCSRDTAACAELLSCTPPHLLPQHLSTQLDGHNVSFIIQALDSHLLDKDPNLVYQHLQHLHTADRFSVVLMLLEKDERCHVNRLFERLSAVESTEFTKDNVQDLAKKYI